MKGREHTQKLKIGKMKKLFVSAIALLAAVSLSAQDLTALFNEAVSSYQNKDFAGAAAKFQ